MDSTHRADIATNHVGSTTLDQASKTGRFSLGSFRRKERKTASILHLSAHGALLWNVKVFLLLDSYWFILHSSFSFLFIILFLHQMASLMPWMGILYIYDNYMSLENDFL